MTRLLAHPFTIDPSGRARTVPQGSDLGYEQALAVLILTRRGERVLVPEYGIADPIGDGLDAAEVQAAADLFGPPVRIVTVDEQPTSPTSLDVRVEWEPTTDDGGE